MNQPPCLAPDNSEFLFQPGAYLISGTDTDVGKTFIGCLLAKEAGRRGLRVGAYKPVASGFPTPEGSDGERLWLATGRIGAFDEVSPQRFAAPLAPQVAAQAEGKTIDEELLFQGFTTMRRKCDLLLVEGAGGLFSPVSKNYCNFHLAQQWNLPVVIVASWRLGVVHQVLSTLHAARANQVAVKAILLSENTPVDQLSRIENGKFLLHSLIRFYGVEHPPILGVDFGATKWSPVGFPN